MTEEETTRFFWEKATNHRVIGKERRPGVCSITREATFDRRLFRRQVTAAEERARVRRARHWFLVVCSGIAWFGAPPCFAGERERPDVLFIAIDDLFCNIGAPGNPPRPSSSFEGRARSNGLIAFADAPGQRPGPRASQYAQIYTMTPDGRNRKQLTTGSPGNFFPAWSPDGKQLAFVSTRNQRREVWIIDSTGKNERSITPGFLPAWSPDGRQLAFTRMDAKRRRQIWIIGIDGRGEKQLTSEDSNHCPAWSPKGDRIAYWSGDARGFGQVWVMRSDGTQRRQLTHPRKNEYTPEGSSANAPAWLFSEKIAYWSGREHRYGQVWTMNADGSDQKQLTHESEPASSDNPTWSPDGKKILFDTQRRRRPEIWVMNSDGSDQRVLLSDLKVIPMRTSWQPVAASRR